MAANWNTPQQSLSIRQHRMKRCAAGPAFWSHPAAISYETLRPQGTKVDPIAVEES